MTSPPPTHVGASPSGEHSVPGSKRSRGRRVTVVAFLLSALVHVLAVAIYPLLVGSPPDGAEARPDDERALQGLEVVRIDEVAQPASPAPPLPELEAPAEPVDPEEAEAPEEAGPTPERIGPPDRRALTPAEELRPREGDPRLTAPLPEELVTVNREWLAELRLIWALEQLNDSATARAAAAAAAQDWTYTDGDGKKWGISPGKIHLGDITIPMPFSFSAPYDSDAAQQARDDAEILRAAIEAATRETLAERARAIRERKDRDRANGRGADTTRVGGGGGS